MEAVHVRTVLALVVASGNKNNLELPRWFQREDVPSPNIITKGSTECVQLKRTFSTPVASLQSRTFRNVDTRILNRSKSLGLLGTMGKETIADNGGVEAKTAIRKQLRLAQSVTCFHVPVTGACSEQKSHLRNTNLPTTAVATSRTVSPVVAASRTKPSTQVPR